MTKAAEKMCITQPAMSFQIRELEKELQVSLFERDHMGIHLTESGKINSSMRVPMNAPFFTVFRPSAIVRAFRLSQL